MTDASPLTAALFVATTGVLAGLFWLGAGRSYRALAVLGAWLAITAGLAARGVLADFSLPPRMFGVLGGALLGVALLMRSPLGSRLAAVPSVAWLVGFQAFRIPVEIVLFRLHQEGIVPVQMTFEGQNWDILTGLTAIPVAALASSGRLPRWGLLAWNVAGMALLLNILTVAVLSMPTVFRVFLNDPANTFITTVPYVWLPGFLVPAALTGHLLVFRRLWATRAAAAPEPSLVSVAS